MFVDNFFRRICQVMTDKFYSLTGKDRFFLAQLVNLVFVSVIAAHAFLNFSHDIVRASTLAGVFVCVGALFHVRIGLAKRQQQLLGDDETFISLFMRSRYLYLFASVVSFTLIYPKVFLAFISHFGVMSFSLFLLHTALQMMTVVAFFAPAIIAYLFVCSPPPQTRRVPMTYTNESVGESE